MGLLKKWFGGWKTRTASPFTVDLIQKENISIGPYTYGRPKIHRWSKKYRVTIGRFCSIADGVQLLVDGNHRSDWISTYPFGRLLPGFPKNPAHPTGKGDIIIGHDVWIGRDALILSGVRIGSGAVIAAGAVVSKNVDDYEIVGGNPARSLGFRFSPAEIEGLMEIAWWNWPLEKIRAQLDSLESNDISGFLASNLPTGRQNGR
jgi:lipopolysaccharide transport system ATP-binding protein